MKLDQILSKYFFLLFLLIACVDRLDIENIKISNSIPVVIDGFISNESGPYTVTVTTAFDVKSEEIQKEPYSVKSIIISDNRGHAEELTEVANGVYQTNKIEGTVGTAYKLRVEFYDGRVYESVPDTILMNGTIDSVYYNYEEKTNYDGSITPQYLISADSKGTTDNDRYMWGLQATFRALTHPEKYVGDCFFFEGKCNFLPPCSGYRNIGSTVKPSIAKVYPCTCCECWYNIYNGTPILSDEGITRIANYTRTEIGSFPVTGWIFMDKVHVQVSMKSLSKKSYKYFQSIMEQKNAVNSLFQPMGAKIPLNFNQLEGNEQDVFGIFYAAGVDKKSFYLKRSQVPYNQLLPTPEDYDAWKIGWVSCLDMFPNGTAAKPDFWED